MCGRVATARYVTSTRGQPTFLNLDAPYQKAIFTVVIWREHREKLGTRRHDARSFVTASGALSGFGSIRSSGRSSLEAYGRRAARVRPGPRPLLSGFCVLP